MSEGVNRVELFGNLGEDPELRTTSGGTAVLSLRLATSERIKKGDNWEDHTEWHRISVWGKRAEGLAKILSKGDRILVHGRLRTRSYEKDGQTKYSTEINADEVFLGGKSGGGEQKSSGGKKSEKGGYKSPYD